MGQAASSSHSGPAPGTEKESKHYERCHLDVKIDIVVPWASYTHQTETEGWRAQCLPCIIPNHHTGRSLALAVRVMCVTVAAGSPLTAYAGCAGLLTNMSVDSTRLLPSHSRRVA